MASRVRRCVRGVSTLCLSCLLLLAVLQALWLAWSVDGRAWRIPHNWIPHSHYLGDDIRLTLRSQAVYLSPDGGLRLEKAALYADTSASPLLQSEWLELRPDLPASWQQGAWVIHSRLQQGRLYRPGQATPSIDPLDLRLTLHGPSVVIESFQARLPRARLRLHGSIPLSALMSEAPKAEGERSTADQLLHTYDSLLLQLQTVATHAEDSLLSIQLGANASAASTALLHLKSRGLAHDAYGASERMEITTRIADLQNLDLREPIEVKLLNYRHPQYGAIESLLASLKTSALNAPLSHLMEHAHISIRQGQVKDKPVEHLYLAAEQETDRSIALQASGHLANSRFRLHGRIHDVDTGQADLLLHLRPDVARLLQWPELQDMELESMLRFEQPPEIIARTRLEPGWSFRKAHFSLRAQGLNSAQTRFHWVDLKGWASDTAARITDAWIENPGYRVRGQYWQQYSPAQYRFLLAGHLYPTDLNSIVKDWWDRLWEPIHFNGPPLWADMDIRGDWDVEDSNSGHVHVRSGPLVYQGVAAQSVNLKVWQQDAFVSLYDFNAATQQGNVDGGLNFIYPRATGETYAIQMDVDSTLPLPELDAIMQAGLGEFTTDMQFSQPPRLKLQGQLDEAMESAAFSADMRIDLQSDAPFNYLGIDFTNGTAAIHWGAEGIDINPISVALNEGVMQGRIFIDKTRASGPEPIIAELRGRDIAFLPFMDNLAATEVPNETPPPAAEVAQNPDAPVAREPPEPLPAPEAPGRLSLQLQADGLSGNPASYSGLIDFSINEADFGKIRMLGALSRLFEGIGLSVGSFDLEQARGNIEIRGDALYFPTLVVSGPTLSIEASGDYFWLTEELNINANVAFLDRPTNPLSFIFRTLLLPIGYVFEVKLFGTTEEPRWRFLFDPRNFAREARRSEPLPENVTERLKPPPAEATPETETTDANPNGEAKSAE